MPRWDFDAAKASAESRWREMLSRVAADGPQGVLGATKASFRGRAVEGCILRHADLLEGGELVFSGKSN